jgi:hypothetical protein
MGEITKSGGKGGGFGGGSGVGLRGWKYSCLQAFIVFHIVAVVCWCVPVQSGPDVRVRGWVEPYIIWTGLFQTWDMFSPAPKEINAYLEAEIIYRNGSSELWTFPRMEQLSLTERTFKERYRKYEESLEHDANFPLWPDAARHIARDHSIGGKQAARVVLLVRWTEILPPGPQGYAQTPWSANAFYTYDVQPGDLQ